MSIRVLLADDHGVLRDAMTRLLASEGDFEVVGTASDGSDAVARLTTPGGPPLGVAPGFAYRQDSITLAPDDRLLIVTDGFTEANDPAGELFGEARIETFLAQAGSGQPATLRRLVEKVREFEAGRPAFDDMAAILLSMSGPPA